MTNKQYTYDKYEIQNVKRAINNLKTNVSNLESGIRDNKSEVKDAEACINQLDVVSVHLSQLLNHIDEEMLIMDIMNS